jgi:hypothetical protein
MNIQCISGRKSERLGGHKLGITTLDGLFDLAFDSIAKEAYRKDPVSR